MFKFLISTKNESIFTHKLNIILKLCSSFVDACKIAWKNKNLVKLTQQQQNLPAYKWTQDTVTVPNIKVMFKYYIRQTLVREGG